MTLIDIGKELGEVDAQILGLIRNDVRIPVPDSRRQIHEGDILVIEADPASIREALSILDLQLEDDRPADLGSEDTVLECDEIPGADEQARCVAKERDVQSDEVTLAEMVIFSHSGLAGRTVAEVRLRTIHRINLLAVSRQGRRTTVRLRFMRLAPGDVLLLQGERGALNDFAVRFGCIPLAERELKLPRRKEAVLAGTVMAAGVGAAAFGWIPAAVSFAGAALACVLLKLIPPRRFYESVDWPVVVLLGALIPVAQAVADTGTAGLIGRGLVEGIAGGNALVSLVLILLATITLTSFMSNAATAAVMCPVAISTAQSLAVGSDPFLMAVAVGASCAFLTPISHQNNTLILGPGGFRFGDYWQLGLPLEILVIGIGVPMILMVWPM
jgi:di/tricarboxylate transporter